MSDYDLLFKIKRDKELLLSTCPYCGATCSCEYAAVNYTQYCWCCKELYAVHDGKSINGKKRK